jgi:hypothetical protein
MRWRALRIALSDVAINLKSNLPDADALRSRSTRSASQAVRFETLEEIVRLLHWSEPRAKVESGGPDFP